MKDLLNILSEKEYLEDLNKISKEKKIPVISYDVGRLLEVIVFIKKPRHILEIGCGEGYSSYFLVKNLKEASFTGIDLNIKRLSKAKEFISLNFPDINVDFYSGNALKIIPDLNCKFDFVFIDAAKYEYPDYLEILTEKLEKDALIIADNIFYSEKIFARYVKEHDKNSVEGVKKFIKLIQNKEIFNTKFIDIGDGLSISIFNKTEF
ncbi:MAG: methyltransferase domain-containing protein [Actinobacteria bacterium]|nr:methyltransferase domain-containing protein [Actinomycetota bacterium]